MRKDRDLMNVGPCNYNKTFIDKRQKAKYSFGAKLDSSLVARGLVTPAPNNYEPTVSLSKMHLPEYRIGKEVRRTNPESKVPAPGTYELSSMASESKKNPRFHMGQLLKYDCTTKYIHSLPGPGSHELNQSQTKLRQPLYSMGKKLNNSPGS